jgi:hypothetical protein
MKKQFALLSIAFLFIAALAYSQPGDTPSQIVNQDISYVDVFPVQDAVSIATPAMSYEFMYVTDMAYMNEYGFETTANQDWELYSLYLDQPLWYEPPNQDLNKWLFTAQDYNHPMRLHEWQKYRQGLYTYNLPDYSLKWKLYISWDDGLLNRTGFITTKTLALKGC